MPRQSTVKFPLRKRNPKRKLGDIADNHEDAENCGSSTNLQSAKRVLFGNSNLALQKENTVDVTRPLSPVKSPFKHNISLYKRDTGNLQSAKLAFHTSAPTRIVGREKELEQITRLLKSHLISKKSLSLYVSGAPGTGKTTSLLHILKTLECSSTFKSVFINCMSLKSANAIYKTIASELGHTKCVSTSKLLPKIIETHLVASPNVTVLVLDEIDHLDSKSQEVLYSLFEWPKIENSKLILIGIANALDLTDRILPRLRAFNCEPELIHFNPYSHSQISAILEDRVSEIHKEGSLVIKPIALQLCARKISACTGDVRKALEVCRRAIEITEKEARQQLALKVTADDRCNPGSPCKKVSPDQCVDLKQINAVLHEIYGSRIQTTYNASAKAEAVHLPLQQGIVLCTLILMKKCCKPNDICLGKVHDTYRRICRKKQMAEVGDSEFYSLCQLIENRGFIELKKNKILRMTKIILKVDETEVEHVLKDKNLMASILSDTSIFGKK